MTETYKCALCGRESDTLEGGAWTNVTMYPLCHNSERSCYESWTRDKVRPEGWPTEAQRDGAENLTELVDRLLGVLP